jgi:hypothetical protein
MGKSIVHCTVCGNAVREGDFAERKAVTVDHRTYCFGCIPAELAQAQGSNHRKGSTSRIPLASPGTRRIPIASRRTSALPIALGTGAAIAVIAIVAVVFSRGGETSRAADPEKAAPRASNQVEIVVRPRPLPSPEATPPPSPEPSPEARPTSPATVVDNADLRATPALKSLTPTITSPSDGAAFEAPSSITIVIDVPGDATTVEIYEGSSMIGALDDRPFTWTWNGVPPGTYRLTAKAKDKTGRALTSPPVSIRVTGPVVAIPEGKKPVPAPVNFGVDPRRVDEAIAKGVVFLKASAAKESINPGVVPGLGECPELILWTLVHARVPENDPDFVKLFNHMMEKKLEGTYAVALQAMILEEVNRVKYQLRIAQCAQFLMDAQCGNGQWSYSGPAQIGTPTTALKPAVASGGSTVQAGGSGPRVKPKVVRRITSLRKMQDGPPTGDNSNSQYAALGMRACSDAGIVIPKAVIQRAQTWWRISQHDEEVKGEKRPAVATGEVPVGLPAGWCYGPKDHGHAPYSSMTAGAVGSVAIWNFLQDEKTWKKDATLQNGIAWLERHFTVAGNDGPSEHVPDTRWMLYYYLYALERAGVLASTETFGPHKWYVEGAEAILGVQRPDGSWLAPLPHGDRSEATNAAWDTCFAILFLKRATRPLDVASTDARGK